jgi:hypothetical protein
MRRSPLISCPVLVMLILVSAVHSQGWKPVVDEVYLQEIGEKIETASPVVSLAFYQGELLTIVGGNLFRLVDGKLNTEKGFEGEATKMRVLQDSLWVFAGDRLHRLTGKDWTELETDGKALDICEHLGEIWVGTESGIFRIQNGTLEKAFSGRRGGGFNRFVPFNESLYFLSGDRLVLYNGKNFEWENVIEWGEFPTRQVRDLLPFGNRLVFATDRGLGELRGTALTFTRGREGLPYEDTTCLARGFDGDLWIGTSHGAIRWIEEGTFHYFAGDRWLPEPLG